MRYYTILIGALFISMFSCSSETPKTAEKVALNDTAVSDTAKSTFTIVSKKDSVIQNGDGIQRYKSGKTRIEGKLKDGKREGLWKSFYEDGTPWSETTFSAGIKNGKTTTWYPNGKKRYQGFYTNDLESGKWTYWDEQGKMQSTKDNDQK